MAIVSNAEQLQYMQAHVDDTMGPSIHISNGILIGAALISVVLRYAARLQSAGGLGQDDFMLFITFVSLMSPYASAMQLWVEISRILPSLTDCLFGPSFSIWFSLPLLAFRLDMG